MPYRPEKKKKENCFGKTLVFQRGGMAAPERGGGGHGEHYLSEGGGGS